MLDLIFVYSFFFLYNSSYTAFAVFFQSSSIIYLDRNLEIWTISIIKNVRSWRKNKSRYRETLNSLNFRMIKKYFDIDVVGDIIQSNLYERTVFRVGTRKNNTTDCELCSSRTFILAKLDLSLIVRYYVVSFNHWENFKRFFIWWCARYLSLCDIIYSECIKYFKLIADI